MPSDDKKDPIENLNDKIHSSGLKNLKRKQNAKLLKAHFGSWHHLYCYGKERSRFNSSKKEAM